MLAPDPSVWLLDFPVKPTVTSPPRSLLNLIRGANPWLLFALSLAICAIVPNLVTLAIYLASAIPWSTILAWVANNLHQVLLRHPTLAFAPTVWVILLFLSVFPSTLLKQPPVASTAPSSPPFTRNQRRRFSRLLKKSFAPPRFNSGIRANKLHRSYPLRLRQRGYVASRPPTLAQRDDFLHFATLKERALRLQRRADKLRNSRRPAPLPPTTGQREGYKNKRSCPSWCSKRPVRRHEPRSIALWHPPTRPTRLRSLRSRFTNVPPPTKSSHTFTGVPFHAASNGSQAPARMREALGPKANTSPIIWDSGASISITPDISDFEGPVTSPGTITQLKGIAKGLQIKGQGEVTWAVHDQLGNLRLLKVPAFHVPNIKVRLLSTSSLLQTYPDETITIEPNRLTLSGVPNDVNRGPVTANVNPQNNLPTSEAYNATDPFKAADALVSIVNTVHERNLNLNEAEKELLRWHYRLGHVGFKKVQFILRSGVVSKTEESRRLQTAACRLTSFPKCAACQYGKQHRRPIPGTTPSSVVKDRAHALKTTISSQANAFRSIILFAALVDVYYLRWKNETRRHVYRWLHLRRPRLRLHFVEHQVSLNSHETLKAKRVSSECVATQE
ncbi:hypothetical protein MHU86_3765 [Fragilaria crotonensis]|nr:hypothetical protein MHU86_3765 [Fragilaria crotonensis]